MPDAGVNGDVEHGANGKFEPKYDDKEIVATLVDAHPEPLKVGEVAERVGCSETTAHNRLHRLSDNSYPGLATKKVGANARVWWVDIEELDTG